MITKTSDGKLVWLENGNNSAGLKHILAEHSIEFTSRGVSSSNMGDYLQTALSNGKVVGQQGTRNIYEFTYNGVKQRVAIEVGSNGFIVSANPKSLP